jgi:LysM repeat protein
MNPTQNTTTIQIDPFNSKTGAGTLSYYAGKYGTTVDALAKLNNISNPNVIQSGGQLKVPTPVLQTTTGVNTADKKNINDLGAIKDTLTNNQANQQNNQQTNTNGNTTSGDTTTTTNDTADKTAIYNNFKSEIEMANNIFEATKLTSSASTQALIDSIKAKYAVRVTQMEDTNKRSLAAKETMGYRSGRARYASLIQEGILTGEELDGQQRISALHAEELTLIAQAEKAQSDLEMELLDRHMTKLSDIQDRKVAELQNLSKLAIDRERLALDKIKQERDISKQDEEMMYKRSEQVSSAMVDSFDALKTNKARADFIAKMAEKQGVDPDVLLSDVNQALIDKKKATLELENIRSEINARNKKGTEDDFGDTVDGADTPERADFFSSLDKAISINAKNKASQPILDDKKLFTADVWKDLVGKAKEVGITQDSMVRKYKDKLYLNKYKFAKNYGWTEEEFNKYKKY